MDNAIARNRMGVLNRILDSLTEVHEGHPDNYQRSVVSIVELDCMLLCDASMGDQSGTLVEAVHELVSSDILVEISSASGLEVSWRAEDSRAAWVSLLDQCINITKSLIMVEEEKSRSAGRT